MIEKINEAKDFISTFTNNKNIDIVHLYATFMIWQHFGIVGSNLSNDEQILEDP